jgi:hypothetical protein
MRRPRAWFAPAAPGRLGVIVRANYVALPLRRLDEDRTKAGESWPDRGRYGARPVPEARSPRQKSPLMERRKAMRFLIAREAKHDILRLAALHAPHLSGARRQRPSRGLRENAGAWLFDN